MKPGDRKGAWLYIAAADAPKFTRRNIREWGEFQCRCGIRRVLAMTDIRNGKTLSCKRCARAPLQRRHAAEANMAEVLKRRQEYGE